MAIARKKPIVIIVIGMAGKIRSLFFCTDYNTPISIEMFSLCRSYLDEPFLRFSLREICRKWKDYIDASTGGTCPDRTQRRLCSQSGSSCEVTSMYCKHRYSQHCELQECDEGVPNGGNPYLPWPDCHQVWWGSGITSIFVSLVLKPSLVVQVIAT